MIKAIIFDADGPLYQHTGDALRREQELLRQYGYHGSVEAFRANYGQEKLKGYVALETVPEMFRNILISIGLTLSDEEARDFADKFDAIHQRVNATPDAIATLRKLKSDGYFTCVLTDSFYSAEAKLPWLERIDLKSYLDDMVSSLDIGKLKNTPDAYQACLDKLGTLAEESIFVGHQQYEMDGARAAHIKSVAILPIAVPDIKADYTINALSELPGLLTKLNSTS